MIPCGLDVGNEQDLQISPKEFLRELWGDQSGIAELTIIRPHPNNPKKGIPKSFAYSYPEGLEQFVLDAQRFNADPWNVYMGVCLRKSKWPEGSRGTNELALSSLCLFVDIDFKDTPREEAFRRLGEFPLKPSIVVSSGGGLHCYWLTKEAVTEDELKMIPVINKAIAKTLGGDHAGDLARILRLPGTLNRKYSPPVPCKIVTWHPDLRYNLDDFDFLGVPEPGPGHSASHGTEEIEHLDVDELPIGEDVKRVIRGGVRAYEELRRSTDPPEKVESLDLSRSGADAWVIGKLLSAGLGEEEIKRIYRDPQNGIGEKYREPGNGDRYLETTIRNCREFLGRNGQRGAAPPAPPLVRPTLPKFDLYKCIPPGSFFDGYIAYAAKSTDAPLQYHLASAITIAAAALGNRVYIFPYYGGRKLFANLFALLIGPPVSVRA